MPYPDGTLLKGLSSAVYVVEGNQRRYIPDPVTFTARGYRQADVRSISDQDLAAIPVGQPLRTTDPHFYQQLIMRFAPQLRLHPQEQYFPCSVPWYLQRARLLNSNDSGFQRAAIDQSALIRAAAAGESSGAGGSSHFYLTLLPDTANRAGQIPVNGVCPAPLYIHIVWDAHSRYIDIQYLFFYAFSGAWAPFGAQEGGWEHVVVRSSTDGQNILCVFFPQRTTVAKLAPGQFSVVDGTHPVVYVACHSHVSYPGVGSYSVKELQAPGSMSIKLVDVTGLGAVLEPWIDPALLVELGVDGAVPPNNQEWIAFNGRWGLRSDLVNDPSALSSLPDGIARLLPPVMGDVLKALPNDPAQNESSLTPKAQRWWDSRTYANTTPFYRLTTMWLGEQKSLDLTNPGQQPCMANTGNYSGQFWKLTPNGSGFYRLTTMWLGEQKSLDLTNPGQQPCMANTGSYSGQFWKLTRPDGTFLNDLFDLI